MDEIQCQAVLIVFKVVWCWVFQDCMVLKMFKEKKKKKVQKHYLGCIPFLGEGKEKKRNLLFKEEIQPVW